MTSLLKRYLDQQNLKLDIQSLQQAVIKLSSTWKTAQATQGQALFHYPVPKISEDGTCSLVEELADDPYDLSAWFGGKTEEASNYLAKLYALVHVVNAEVNADWLGIYKKNDDASCLLKLAYQGLPSRAEFPLSEAFAIKSNNSRVGLTGKGAIINDISAWRATGGSYYECDPKVKSEVCLPVLDVSGAVLGILDAESASKDFFNAKRQTWLAALAIVLAEVFASKPHLAKT